MKLSDNLKIIRKENNLSQEQLAEKLGVSRQAVSKWESGQSYPEMDKVLLICKLFNYNIDELMNENVKEVNETKESKINLNKYVDDFFGFITKTVEMLCSMKIKQRVKCVLEQIFVALILAIIFAMIGGILDAILGKLMIGAFSHNVYYSTRNILGSIYMTLALVVGIAVLLHIFKIRYLDYYEIIKEDNSSGENVINEEKTVIEDSRVLESHKKKEFIEKKKEKIIIRDPRTFRNEIFKWNYRSCYMVYKIRGCIFWNILCIYIYWFSYDVGAKLHVCKNRTCIFWSTTWNTFSTCNKLYCFT